MPSNGVTNCTLPTSLRACARPARSPWRTARSSAARASARCRRRRSDSPRSAPGGELVGHAVDAVGVEHHHRHLAGGGIGLAGLCLRGLCRRRRRVLDGRLGRDGGAARAGVMHVVDVAAAPPCVPGDATGAWRGRVARRSRANDRGDGGEQQDDGDQATRRDAPRGDARRRCKRGRHTCEAHVSPCAFKLLRGAAIVSRIGGDGPRLMTACASSPSRVPTAPARRRRPDSWPRTCARSGADVVEVREPGGTAAARACARSCSTAPHRSARAPRRCSSRPRARSSSRT